MSPHRKRRSRRTALTLIELLSALTIMTFIMGALAVLARGVQVAAKYSDGQGTAVQHGRVIIERITSKIRGAYANALFPGVAVVDTKIGSDDYPNTLVVWSPSGAAANLSGAPLLGELVIYAPNPSAPNEFWEVTDRGNTTALNTFSASTIQTDISGLISKTTSKKTVLTDLMRAVTPTGVANTSNSQQAAVRFLLTLTPSASQMKYYSNGTVTWANLPWPQDLYGASTGIRNVWVRMELQLNAGPLGGISGNAEDLLPCLGSATLNYALTP
ncbi:MAG TPA: hypothetical protein VFE24_14515 [Pirellulales bacterium]|jgi:hypothetical protein|nr:hypothetical protein [Pirellulales bacterium]